MASSPDPSSVDSASAKPLVDSPVEGLLDWDNPFRQTFVAGSEWAPWLASSKFPPRSSGPGQANPPLRTVQPPEPPAPSSSDEEYARYRRDYEARLDEAYAQWKRSVFTSLFEPWIVDRRAEEAAKKLGRGLSAGA
jgi:hypothetical protein